MCICWCVTYINYKMHGATMKKVVLVLLNILTSHVTKPRQPDTEFTNRLFKVLSVL